MIGKELLNRIALAVTHDAEYLRNLPQFKGKTDTEILEETEETLANYPGDSGFLNHILTSLGTYNPWRASTQTILINTIKRRSEREKQRQGRVITTTAGARPLIDQNFEFFDPETEAHASVGLTSAYKFRTAFGTPTQQQAISLYIDRPLLDEGAARYLARIEQIKQQARTGQITIRSRTLKLYLQAQADAERELTTLLKEDLASTTTALAEVMRRQSPKSRYLSLQHSREDIFTHMEEHLDEKKPILQRAYTIARSVDAPDEEKTLAFALLWQDYAQHRFVNTAGTVGDEIDDLSFLEQTEDNNLLKYKNKKHHPLLEDIINTEEISVQQAGLVLDAADFEGLRTTAWNALPKTYMTDLSHFEDLFAQAFEHEGALISPTVRKELSDHPYSRVLVQQDWRAALDLFIDLRLHGSLEEVAKRTSVRTMKRHVEKAVSIIRRIEHMDNPLLERRGTYEPLELHPEHAELVDRLVALKGRLHGSHWMFSNQYGEKQQTLITMGLYDTATSLPRGLREKLFSYTAAADHQELIDSVRRILASPTIRANPHYRIPRYFDKGDERELKAIAATTEQPRAALLWSHYDRVMAQQRVSGSVGRTLELVRSTQSPQGLALHQWGSVIDENILNYREARNGLLERIVYMARKSSAPVLAIIGMEVSSTKTWEEAKRITGSYVEPSLEQAVNEVFAKLPRRIVRLHISFRKKDEKFLTHKNQTGQYHFDKGVWTIDVPEETVEQYRQRTLDNSSVRPDIRTEIVKLR